MHPPLSRRLLLTRGLAGLAVMMGVPALGACSDADDAPVDAKPRTMRRSNLAAVGALGEPDANGVRLPPGFTSRIVARAGEKPAPSSDYEWHIYPDGGATFATEDGGWIYVSNCEFPISGGVGALRFGPTGDVVDAYRLLDKTNVNCAGGATPWGTWLSCEEVPRGQVHECYPLTRAMAAPRPALGVFKHEAVAIDPQKHHAYLTEDEPDGCFYRFVPAALTADGHLDLTAGTLQVAQLSGTAVTWHDLPDPQYEGKIPTREQVAAATRFKGGEGIVFHAGVIYFSTKGDNRVWSYHTVAETLTVLYDVATAADPILSGVDNLTVTSDGDVLVAEDGGDMQVVAILADGTMRALAQVVGHDKSEIAGVTFDPSGTRLYFSSQRGETDKSSGVTFEVTGPFHVEVPVG